MGYSRKCVTWVCHWSRSDLSNAPPRHRQGQAQGVSEVRSQTGVSGALTPKSITIRRKEMKTTKASPQQTNRRTAAIVGVLFIIGTVSGILSVPIMGGILGAP